MVARSPPKLKKIVAPINPLLLRETLTKVDQCMSRLQELQYTVSGGTRTISAVNLSPRSTRGYLRTSLRCKQESLRIKNATPKKSPVGKYPTNMGADWRRMSLPAMLLGETVGEIIQASQFAKEIVEAANAKIKGATADDPKTPVTQRRKQRPDPDNTELRTRRKREKQSTSQSIRSVSPKQLQRARSRINFKVSSSPPKKIQSDKENARYLAANRVSPKLKPWAKKTVLFPNPLFVSTPSKTQNQKFCKTMSPIIMRKRETPHKFLIKSPQPPSASSKFQVRIKSPAKVAYVCISPTRLKSPAAKVVASTASKLRRSFSPSRLASRFVSPLKNRKNVEKMGGGGGGGGDGLVMMSGLKRPALVSMRHSTGGGRRD